MPAAETPLLEIPAAASTQVAMATFDAALVCTYANDRFAEVAGLDDGVVVGSSWAALFPGLPAGQQALVDAVADAGPAVAEVDVTTAATGRAGLPVGARQRWWSARRTSSASTSTRPRGAPTWPCSVPTCRHPGRRRRSVTGCAGRHS